MKKTLIVILFLFIVSPCFSETSSTSILQPNTNGYYEACDGTYIHVDNKTMERTYYVQGVKQTKTFLGKTAQEKYEEAEAAKPVVKTLQEQIEDLKARILKLEK